MILDPHPLRKSFAEQGPIPLSGRPLFEIFPTFFRTLCAIRDENLAVCFPFGGVYPLNFSVSGDRENLFQPRFMLVIQSPGNGSGAHISLNAYTPSANRSSAVEEYHTDLVDPISQMATTSDSKPFFMDVCFLCLNFSRVVELWHWHR
jgi:hypothetical protein